MQQLTPAEIAEQLRQDWLRGIGHVTQLPGKAVPSTQKYYSRHRGYDIGTPAGTPVYAPVDLEVISRNLQKGYGQRLQAYLPDRNQTAWLSHLSKILVDPGRYKAGTLLGYTGGTPGTYGAGNTTGAHIDFELSRGRGVPVATQASTVNPQSYAQRLLQMARTKNPNVMAISNSLDRLRELENRGYQIVKMTL